MRGPDRARVGTWIDRPIGAGGTLAIIALISAAPAWLMADTLRNFYLKGDDFVYIAQSRTWPRLVANLWEPFNSHVVPLFRLATFALIAAAGGLANLPTVLASATYVVLVLLMIAGGAFVAREASAPALGLAAMAALGITTVLEPAVTWYAAGQTLWAGLGILVMLLALQVGRDADGPGRSRRGRGWLVLAILAALASAALWSGGYVAGPVGATYLWADGRPRSRKLAAVPLLATAAFLALTFALRGGAILAPANFHDRSPVSAANPLRGLLYTAQAIPEALVLGNLGLDAATDAGQAVALVLCLAGVWACSRTRGPGLPRPNPLEAAGAVLVVLSFGLAYTFRSYLPFDSLRPIRWYHTLPQIGAVLFASGWWSALAPRRSAGRRPLTIGGALAVLTFVAFLLVVQAPPARRYLLDDAPTLSASERSLFPITSLQRLRALYLLGERAEDQRQFLARLDRAERTCLRGGISRAAIHAALGRVAGPGLPDQVPGFDATNLLDLPPPSDPPAAPARVRALLGEWLTPPTARRPPWIPPDAPWPPSPGA